KWKSNRTRERIRRWTARMEKLDSPIEQYLRDGTRSRQIVPRRSWQFAALENYLFHRMNVSGTPAEIGSISRMAAELYSETYRKSLRSRKWNVRMNALVLIGIFRMKGIEENVRSVVAAGKTGHLEKWTALRVLALLRYPDIINMLLSEDAKHETDIISEHMYRSVLMVMPVELLEELIGRIGEARIPLRLNLIDVLRIRNIRTERVLAWLEVQLADPSEECPGDESFGQFRLYDRGGGERFSRSEQGMGGVFLAAASHDGQAYGRGAQFRFCADSSADDGGLGVFGQDRSGPRPDELCERRCDASANRFLPP
ncbi:MAG: hypothetical protein K0R28_7030, partial [Paenibacillus sp.]|nr:hypothetical protein [Paenibacillus sp.]